MHIFLSLLTQSYSGSFDIAFTAPLTAADMGTELPIAPSSALQLLCSKLFELQAERNKKRTNIYFVNTTIPCIYNAPLRGK